MYYIDLYYKFKNVLIILFKILFVFYIYINFETNDIIGKIINENITPDYIIKNLEVVFNKKIDKDNIKSVPLYALFCINKNNLDIE